MVDLSSVIVPKSDQINADTLIAGPMTVTIREVRVRGGQEQPVDILLNETALAYRPCKSMCRVLVQAWGPDTSRYVGRGMTLYRDASVKWGGMEVGGIRISHMTDLNAKMAMALTATKGIKKVFEVRPLVMPPPGADPAAAAAQGVADDLIQRVGAAADLAALQSLTSHAGMIARRSKLTAAFPDLAEKVNQAIVDALAAFEAEPEMKE